MGEDFAADLAPQSILIFIWILLLNSVLNIDQFCGAVSWELLLFLYGFVRDSNTLVPKKADC